MLNLKCNCGFLENFYTSKECGKSYDINRRIIYSMRSCGQGFSSIEKFTALMNMPKPMTKKNYNAAVELMSEATSDIANQTMINAANEIKGDNMDNVPVDTAISNDGR